MSRDPLAQSKFLSFVLRHQPETIGLVGRAVDAGRMQADGFKFYVADNGVWLTDAVPPGYLIDVPLIQDTHHG